MCNIPSQKSVTLSIFAPKDWSHDEMTLPHLDWDDHEIHLFFFLDSWLHKTH